MDLPATQVYVDEDTQKASDCVDEKKLIQVGTIIINSIKYQIKKGITKIGRLDTCDIVINDETVSKVHAEIDASIDGEAAFICDLDSSNKTKLNNVILRPSRLYELKDKSIIKFGKVCAFYKVYRSSDDILVPETPVPERQQITESVIPDTPDLFFNKSCSTDSDASIIIGTPINKESSIFRRPIVQQLEPTNVDKESTAQIFINENNCSNIARTLNMSDIENQETTILNTEKQEFSTDISENVKPTLGVKQLFKINTVNKTTGISMTDIHDIEAKNQKGQINIGSAFNKQSTAKTHDMETQDYGDFIYEMPTQKLENDENKIQVKNTNQYISNLCNLKIQKFNNEGAVEGTSNINTQIKLNEVANEDYNNQNDKDENKYKLSNINSKTNNKTTSKPQNSDSDEDDIFNAPTQQDEQCRILQKKSRLSQQTVDSETDTEKYLEQLPKKQHRPLSLNKSHLENFDNINNPSTSIESEDMFDVSTQSAKNYEAKNTSNLSNKQLQNIDKNSLDNITSKQIINNIKSTCKCDNTNTTDINKLPLLQLNKVSSRTATNSKVVSLKNSHDIDDMVIDDINTDMSKSVDCVNHTLDLESASPKEDQFDEYSDQENRDYEMAPTQSIGEIESEGKEKNTTIKDSNCGKVISSSKEKLNETLEQNLNEMFDNMNNENVYESSQLSTQCLKNILELSQCNDNASQTSLKKEGRASRTLSLRKASSVVSDRIDVNKTENDPSSKEDEFSEYSDQENLDYEMAPTQLIEEIESKGKEKNTTMKDSNCGKVISSSKKKLNDTLEQNLNKMFDNANNENVYESSQLSTQCLKNILESSQDNDNVSQTSLKKEGRTSHTLSLRKVSSVASNRIDVNKTENAHRNAQTSEISYDSDDDFLARFPAVRISGTLSNPPSPSVASTSRMCNEKSKQSPVTRSNRKKSILSNKLSHRRNIKQSAEKKNQINIKSPLRDNCSSVVNINSSKANRISDITTTYGDSNNEISCEHMTDKMSNNELSNIKKRKGNRQVTNQPKKRRNTRSLTNTLKKVKEDIKTKASLQTDTRALRSLSRQNNESLCAPHMTKEIRTENVNNKSTDQKAKASMINKKRSSNLIEEDMEQYSKKYKVNLAAETCSITTKQSSNISEYSRRNSLRKNSSVTASMKCSEKHKIPKIVLRRVHGTFLNSNIDTNNKYKKDNVTKIKYEIDNRNSQATVYNANIIAEGNSNRNKKTQTKRKKTESSKTQDNTTKVLSNLEVGQESQEVEMIMEKVLDNVHDKYLAIRQNSNAKTLQRKLLTRSNKHSNVNKQTKSGSTENIILSNTDDFDNIKSDNMLKTTNKKSAKSCTPSLTIPPTKREVFENRTRLKQHSTRTLFDSSVKNSDNVQNKNLTYPRSSRSKIITQKKEKVNKPINNTVSGIENTSMASRTRRSVSSLLNNSSFSSTKHNIIFTGITEEKYNKIVKTLGGQKVEHPDKCTILVTDKIRRTYKFLCALAKGVPIVTINWLEDSESAGHFLNWETYILKDPAAEAKFGFKLRKSLNKTKEKRLLEDYTVLLTPNIVQPPIKELKDMIIYCGGKTLLRPPTKWPEKVVIISCEEDLSTAKKFLTKTPKTTTIQSTEFILTGILRQEMDFVKHILM